MMRH